MSIQRVAEAAGVPYSTTWRVINRVSGVSEQAAEAVRKAMEQVGYSQSPEKQRKVLLNAGRRRHRCIAMLDLRENWLSISILRAVQRILLQQKTNLVFGHVTGPDDLPPAVVSGEVDGILGYGHFPLSAVTPKIKQIPAVWMLSPSVGVEDAWGDRVMTDHRAIGSLAARYLLDKGHLHLAFLNSAPAYAFFGERGRGFAASAEGRADAVHTLVSDPIHPPNSPEAIAEVINKWAALSPRPSGLFAPTDQVTVAVYQSLTNRGIRIGRDVEVVSCDKRDDQLSALHPEPVSIDLNREVVARLAVERLLWRIREGLDSPSVRILVGPKLDGYTA